MGIAARLVWKARAFSGIQAKYMQCACNTRVPCMRYGHAVSACSAVGVDGTAQKTEHTGSELCSAEGSSEVVVAPTGVRFYDFT